MIGTRLTPKYTIIASLLCLGHMRERCDTFRLFTSASNSICLHIYIVYMRLK